MKPRQQIIVRVAPDGQVSAETKHILGSECLSYIDILENLLEARTVDSALTEDYTRTTTALSSEAQHELPEQR